MNKSYERIFSLVTVAFVLALVACVAPPTGTVETRAQMPSTETETPEDVEVNDDVNTYANTDYGFKFKIPTGWIVEELSGAIKLRNEVDQLQLYIGYRRLDESWGNVWTSMPAGEFGDIGEVPFLSASLTKSLLTYEGKVKVVTYGGPRGTFETLVIDGVQFVVRLDDMTPYTGRNAYAQVEVTAEAQNTAEEILASFEPIPAPE